MRAFPLLSLLLLPACATVTRHGDARLVVPGIIQLAPTTGRLEFPRIAIGHLAHHHFAVRSLPRPIYPQALEIIAPQREEALPAARQPWSGAVLSVRLVALDGTVFLQQVLAFENGKNGALSPATDSSGPSKLFLRNLHGWNHLSTGPEYLSYDVYIDVVSASRRPTDEVGIYAPAPL